MKTKTSLAFVLAFSSLLLPTAHGAYPEASIVSGSCIVQEKNHTVPLQILPNYQHGFGIFAVGKTPRGTDIRILLNRVHSGKLLQLEIGSAHAWFAITNGVATLELANVDGKGGGWIHCNLAVKVESN